jgi:hypothetical protein
MHIAIGRDPALAVRDKECSAVIDADARPQVLRGKSQRLSVIRALLELLRVRKSPDTRTVRPGNELICDGAIVSPVLTVKMNESGSASRITAVRPASSILSVMFGLMTTDVNPLAAGLRRMLSSQRARDKMQNNIKLAGRPKTDRKTGQSSEIAVHRTIIEKKLRVRLFSGFGTHSVHVHV